MLTTAAVSFATDKWSTNFIDGSVPERPKGTGCKPVGASLRWFDSNPAQLIGSVLRLSVVRLVTVTFSGRRKTARASQPKPFDDFVGGVAKRPKAMVCKTIIRGFESHRRL